MIIIDMSDSDGPTQAFQNVCKDLLEVTYAELLMIADAITALRNAMDRKNGVLDETIQTGNCAGEAWKAACCNHQTVEQLLGRE